MGTIQLSGVGRSFKSTAAVSDIDLIIEDGGFVVLLGPSGCGKTTLLRMIAGLLEPTAGRIHLDGDDITDLPSKKRDLAMVFQSWCMQGLFLSNGAQVLSDDRTTIEFGSDAAIDTVATFTEMYEDGVLTNEDFTSQYEAFAQGKTAIHVNSSAVQGAFMMGAEAGGWTLDAHTLPAFGDQAVVPTNSGSFLAMFATDPAKQAAAWELMQFMTSPRAYEIISTQIGYLPLRSSMADEGGPLYDWVEANPLVKPNLEQLDALEPWVSYPGDSYAQVDQVLATAIEDAVFYGADPAATMTEAAERAQGLIE